MIIMIIMIERIITEEKNHDTHIVDCGNWNAGANAEH